jgi:Histone H1-like nucleoprotein HC2/S1 RNA binding domain/Zc3h12a-like Ribonuclease NYN domain
MTAKKGPAHVVVDGSNIATEGRSLPSLTQLNDAVMSYMAEHPDTAVTVVVDATFGHRIDKKEAAEFEAGISNNELVAPPAGAVGRGDAFVLGIADKANATVLSNDSFQEFHGEYKWLFDTGRLVGGKPVPHVGWVFVDRVPVRGPVSRKATGGSRSGRSSSSRRGSGSRKSASEPMPVPSSPPPRPSASPPPESAGAVERDQAASPGRAPRRGEQVNELLPFLEFVEHHPIGTSVNGTVDAYSSHGAYIMIGDEGVRGYVPLRLMSDPPPRSARQEMKQGESVTVVVVSFAAARRSIDCALPDMADRAIADASGDRDRDGEAAPSTDAAPTGPGGDEPPTSTGAKRTSSKKAAAKKSAKKSAAKRSPAKKTAAKKTAAKKTAAQKTAAKKTAAKKTATKKAASKRSSTRKTAAKKTPAKKSAAKKTATKKSGAKPRPARKSALATELGSTGSSGEADADGRKDA